MAFSSSVCNDSHITTSVNHGAALDLFAADALHAPPALHARRPSYSSMLGLTSRPSSGVSQRLSTICFHVSAGCRSLA